MVKCSIWLTEKDWPRVSNGNTGRQSLIRNIKNDPHGEYLSDPEFLYGRPLRRIIDNETVFLYFIRRNSNENNNGNSKA
jgi:hypothetical protein